MKKILLFITLFLLIPNRVLAETYTKYSEYYYSDKEIKEDETKEVEIERRYKYYYMEKVYDNNIYNEPQIIKGYPNEEIYIDDEITESNIRPQNAEILLEKKVTNYLEYEQVRYIRLYATSSELDTTIYEIDILYKGEEIDYIATCTNDRCSEDLIKNINNGIYENENSPLSLSNNIYLDLQKEYNPYDIEIIFYIDGTEGTFGRMLYTINNDMETENKYFNGSINMWHKGKEEIHLLLKDIEHYQRYSGNIKQIDGEYQELSEGKIINIETLYTYHNKTYRYYKLEKKYIDGYFTELDEFIKDENNYKDYYKYRYKEEIEIPIKEIIKEVEVPIEIIKEVEVTKEVEVPIEKIITNQIEVPTERVVEVPVEKIIEKEIIKEKEVNKIEKYSLEYIIYLVAGIILKKMSFFK